MEHSLSHVKKRLETNLKNRKSSRLTAFDHLRDLPQCESPKSNVKSKIEHRRQQLEIWKKQKEKQKKEAAAQKKKPFVAGVAHPSLKFVPPPPAKPMPSTSGRVTRSQNSRNKPAEPTTQSFAPKNASFKPPELKNAKKLTLAPPKSKTKKQNITFDPVMPAQKETRQTRSRATKTEAKAKIETKAVSKNTKTTKQKPKIPLTSSSSSELDHHSPVLQVKPRKSLIAPNSPQIVKKTPRKSLQITNVTPKNGVPKSESSSEERLRSPKNSESSMTPDSDSQKISPCVTMSRGKDNARKEMKKKLDEGLLDEDASDMDSVEHFRKQLASEIKRMTEMCETWDKIMEQTVLPDTVQEAVLAAVGQARLLMSAKLQQFAGLLEACARPVPGAALVTPADLHGFWDMVFMQVENVDMRFKKLEELKSSGWVVEQVEPVKKKITKIVPKKVTAAAPSRLREMIAAARKAKNTLEPLATEQKTFEAGFFSVRSPLRSPRPSPRSPTHTPARSCLLKAVLSSEAKKASASKNSASFAMLRASVLSKNYECEGVAPIPPTPLTPVNIYATPGRSILKTNTEKSNRKSIKMVLFDKSESETQDSSYHTPEFAENNGLISDSGLSYKDQEKVEDKENSKKKLTRQDAEDRSPILTRSRRRSINPEGVTPRRSARKKVVEDEEKTPRRASRRKSGLQVQN